MIHKYLFILWIILFLMLSLLYGDSESAQSKNKAGKQNFYYSVIQQIMFKMQLQNPEVPHGEIQELATSWIKQLLATMNEVASRNILESASKLVVTANSL